MTGMDAFIDKINKLVHEHKVLMFIKGTKDDPMCGFSAQTIQIFKKLGKPFETVNVLSNPEIRSRLHEYSQWPTFPQVFVNGQFIGGCDIVTEMNENGELKPLVEKAFADAR